MKYLYSRISGKFHGGGNFRCLVWIVPLLLSLFAVSPVSAQTARSYTLQGVVLDQNGDPFVGVTVTIPGSNAGTTTGRKGDYRILVSRGCDSLRFSFIGYKTLTVSVRDAQLVRMQEDVASVGEVVVTGIFSRKAESYTGTATTINGESLKKISSTNVFQSLKSLDPSLNIVTNLTAGSDPNALPDMQLRGTSTFPTTGGAAGMDLKGNYIGNPNTPLFVLDGFETTVQRIFDMDMNRIASVTILKDAAAKAIYGAKAANGVVVIETKPLLANETRITYEGKLTLEMPDLTSYNLCNALEKLQIEKAEGFYDNRLSAKDNVVYQELYNKRLEWAQAGNSTYWLSKPLRTGVGHSHSVNVEMGENALRAAATFAYKSINGVMKGSERETLTGDVKLEYRYKKIKFQNIMSVWNVNSKESPYGSFSQYATLNPYWSPYDSEGKLVQTLSEKNSLNGLVGNPLYDATLSTRLTTNNINYSDNFYVEILPIENLRAVARIGISGQRLENETFYPSEHSRFITMVAPEDVVRKGSYSMVYGRQATLDGNFIVQYSKDFAKKHSINAAFNMLVSENKFTESTFRAEGFPSDKMDNISYARQYAEGTTPQSYDVIRRQLQFMGNFSYSYDNRYVVEGTINYSGASSFGSNNKWGSFWSVGASWNLHNERFLRNIRGLNNLRLRFSYGRDGNSNFASNNSFALYNYLTTGQYNGFTGAILQNMENPDLKWQVKDQYNIGFDMMFRRLSINANYYYNLTKNLVSNIAIAPSTGFNTVDDNLGEVMNRGWEVSVGYTPWQSRDGFLNISAAITTNKNEITKLSESMRVYNELQNKLAEQLQNTAPVQKYIEGMPLNAIWAVPSLGIDPMCGREVFVNKDGQRTYEWSYTDMVYCGQTDPKYRGTVGFNVEYKGIGLSAYETYEGGCEYYNYTLVQRVEDASLKGNVDRRVLAGRWTTPGQHALYTTRRITYSENGNSVSASTRLTSRFVQRRDEFSISSLNVYYNFSEAVARKMRLKRLQLKCSMDNVATFSSIRLERGTSYPFARTLYFTLLATF